jgi:hypothetical protein
MVIPAKAGIQYFKRLLDSRFRGSDGSVEVFRISQSNWMPAFAGMTNLPLKGEKNGRQR